MKYLVMSLFFISSTAFSQINCAKPVTKLEKGQVAECTGYLFSPETELEARIAVQTNDKLKEYINVQKDVIKLQDERINNQFNQLRTLETVIQRQEKTNYLMNALYFGVGVLVTGFIASNVGK